MSLPLYANNATSTIATTLLITDTTVNILAGTESLFPSPTGGDYFWVTLSSATTTTREIVKCTARTGTVLTIVRAQQNTVAAQFAVGDTIALQLTAQDLADFQSRENVLFKTLSGGTITLTAAEEANSIFEFSGTLLSDSVVIISNNVKRFYADNLTTGNFTLTVKTLAGAGVTIPQGQTIILYNNGTAVEDANTSKANNFITINAQVGTTYTFTAADAYRLCTFANASPITVTIPPNSSVPFPIGTKIDCLQDGAGKVTIAQGAGVTINSQAGNKSLAAQYVGVTLIKEATDTWYLVGNLIP